MKNRYLIFVLLVLFFACKSYEPFGSRQEKRQQVKMINSSLNLTKSEFIKIRSNDSVLFSISKSISENVERKKIKRRIDSFLVDNYTADELLTTLFIERKFPNKNFEINRSKTLKSFKMGSVEELEKFFNKGGFDSLIKKTRVQKRKVIIDSTKQKKQKQ